MKKRIIFFSLFILFFSCRGEENKKEEKKEKPIIEIAQNTQMDNIGLQNTQKDSINLQKIEEHIELQKRVFVEDHIPDNEYIATQEDLDLQLLLLEKSLENSGYKFPDYSLFKERIKYVFGIDIDKSEENIVTLYAEEPVYDKGKAYTDEEIKHILLKETNLTFDQLKYSFSSHDWNLFIDKQRKIITPMVFLNDLIKIKGKDKKEYSIQQNLKVLSLNKYLIYNDKASLNYLLPREAYLSRSLLLNFNYDKEDKINENVMDSLYTSYANNNFVRESEIRSLIFVMKDQPGQDRSRLYIREGILKTIENITNENEGKYAIDLMNAFVSIVVKKRDGKNIGWTNEELYKIVAYSANYIDPLYWKYHKSETVVWGRGDILGSYDSLLSEKEWEAMLKQFKENNYYNLPNLKGLVKRIMNW